MLLMLLVSLATANLKGQFLKYPSNFQSQVAAEKIIQGNIGLLLNDSVTTVTFEKKNDRWVTTDYPKDIVVKKINKILSQGVPVYTGRTNAGYRFYINVFDVNDDTKLINSLDITIDAFTQQIKNIEIKL